MWGYGGVKIRMPLWRLNVTLQNSMCFVPYQTDCVRPVHLWGTNRYWPKVPVNAAERYDCLFQQAGTPSHWYLAVRTFFNEHLPNRWIGRVGQNDQMFCKWPPRSPDLTVCDFFLWGYVKKSLCTSTARNRGWAAGTHHCSCQVGQAGYAPESLVRARLSNRCLPSNKSWVCIIPHETVWVYKL